MRNRKPTMQLRDFSKAHFLGPSSIAISLSLLASTALAGDAHKWHPHLEVGGKFSNSRNIGETTVFVPLFQNETTLLFGDVRGRFDNNSSEEINVGAGVRKLFNDQFIIGGYGFYDLRNSEYGHQFQQITLGAEVLTEAFELRGNVYLPIGTTEYSSAAGDTVALSGSSILFTEGQERALQGFDAEIGVKVPWTSLTEDGTDALRLYAGGYHFDDAGVDAISGPRFRAEYTLADLVTPGSRLSINAEYQHDSPRGSQTFFGAKLRLPLYGTAQPAGTLSPLEHRMTDTIQRDVDIVSSVGAYGSTSVGVDAATGRKLSDVKVVEASDETTLRAGIEGAEAGDIIFVQGPTGGIDLTSPISLRAGQSVGSGFNVIHPQTRRTASFGGALQLHGLNADQNMVHMTSDTSLSGFEITGGRHAVFADGADNVHISNLHIHDISGSAINVMNSDEVSISNIAMREVAYDDDSKFQNSNPNGKENGVGLRLYNVTDVNVAQVDMNRVAMGTLFNKVRNANIDGLSITSTQNEGFVFHNVQNAVIENVAIETLGQDAMAFVVSGNITVRNASTKHLPNPEYGWSSGINITDYTGDPEVDEATRASANKNYSFENISIDGAEGHGLYIQGIDDLALKDVTITNIGQNGMFLNMWEGMSNVSLENVVIDGTGTTGIYHAMGQMKNISGDLTIRNTPTLCQTMAFTGEDFLTQEPGNELRVNGKLITPEMMATREAFNQLCAQ